MHTMHLAGLMLASVLTVSGVASQGQPKPKPRRCPVVSVDTSAWMLARDPSVGIEIKHPADYREKHWESRSDSSGVALSLWRNAVSTIDFNEFHGFYTRRGPNPSVVPCRLAMRSGELALHVERSASTLPSGRDTLYYLAKGIFTPTGKPPMLFEINASDSTALLEQMAILRTIRFLNDR
jgi:hypothetical protein